MSRTGRDQRSSLGRFRIYNKQYLPDDVRGLHDGGPWFVEPANWPHPQPYAPGYATLDQARLQADVWEESSQFR